MRPTLRTLWALVALPFFITAAIGGPAGGVVPHALFHPVYILFTVSAIVVLWQFRTASESRVVRGTALALLVAQVAVVVGMVGEEIAVLQHGGLSTGKEMLEEPLHVAFADTLTVPALLLSMVLLIVLTIVTLVRRRADRRLPVSGPA